MSNYRMTGKWASGLRVYERLFDYVHQQGNVRFVTLGQLAELTNDERPLTTDALSEK